MSASSVTYIRLCPSDIAVFRFLLEAYEHVGYFSVLERQTSLLKFVYTEDMAQIAHRALREIAGSVPLTILPSPFSGLDA
ncbi:MAG: DUF4911 domain-containing protein [Desulfovibrio sp.]|nr:DUF4911 domain-containing protein [Desulfovibrio sp.]